MDAQHGHEAVMPSSPGVLALIQDGLRDCITPGRPYTPSPCADDQRSVRTKAL